MQTIVATCMSIIMGLVTAFQGISSSLLDLVLLPLLSRLGVSTIPPAVLTLVHGIGVMIDTVIPIHTFVTGLNVILAAWEFYIVSKSYAFVVRVVTWGVGMGSQLAGGLSGAFSGVWKWFEDASEDVDVPVE